MRDGKQGIQGEPGERGQIGPTGHVGAPADPAAQRTTTRRLRFLFTLLVVVVLVGAFAFQREQNGVQATLRSQASSQHQIDHNTYLIELQRYQSCLAGVAIVNHFNATQLTLAAIEAKAATIPGTTARAATLHSQRVAAYQQAVIALKPNSCGFPPERRGR